MFSPLQFWYKAILRNYQNHAFSIILQTTIFKQLIYITCVNGFIEVQLYEYYMFRLVEPSSGNTCLQQFILKLSNCIRCEYILWSYNICYIYIYIYLCMWTSSLQWLGQVFFVIMPMLDYDWLCFYWTKVPMNVLLTNYNIPHSHSVGAVSQ
jgi:hypothetical protein